MRHPLEPLSAGEIARAVEVLSAAGLLTPTTRVVSIMLTEPPKTIVHAGTGWEALPRLAAAVLFDNAANTCYEADLDLTAGTVTACRHVPGVQPTMTIDEQVECEQAVLQSPEFAAALSRQYGITDTRLVMVDIWSAGYYGAEEERGMRLARPLCFVRTDLTDNGYVRPIEGIRPNRVRHSACSSPTMGGYGGIGSEQVGSGESGGGLDANKQLKHVNVVERWIQPVRSVNRGGLRLGQTTVKL